MAHGLPDEGPEPAASEHRSRSVGPGPRGPLARRGRLIGLIALVALLAFLFRDSLARLSIGALLMVGFWVFFALFVLGRGFWSSGRPLGDYVKPALAWVAIVAVLATGYAFRRELGAVGDRVSANLGSGQGYRVESGVGSTALAFERASDGHFYVRGAIGDTSVRFLVDTGASQVVLSPKDAARLGLRPPRSAFRGRVRTANGTVAVAPIRIPRLTVGQITVREVPALVHGRSLDQSLLGQSFLNRLDGYEVRDGRLILRQNNAG